MQETGAEIYRGEYPERMNETAELREKIRQVLEDVVSSEPQVINDALNRIMDVVDPFQQLAREELERFRSTFAELAK